MVTCNKTLQNGHSNCSADKPVRINDYCEFACNEGYHIHDSTSTAKYLADESNTLGEWNRNFSCTGIHKNTQLLYYFLFCFIAIKCKKPQVENGVLQCPDIHHDEKHILHYNDECTVVCLSEYDINRPASIKCKKSTGHGWNTEPAKCVD